MNKQACQTNPLAADPSASTPLATWLISLSRAQGSWTHLFTIQILGDWNGAPDRKCSKKTRPISRFEPNSFLIAKVKEVNS